MRLELLIFIIIILLGLTPLIPQRTGMQTFGYYTLADYPYMFFKGRTFDAVISKGFIRDSGEIQTANLFITQLPEQYRLLQSAGTGPGGGYAQIRIFPGELKGKIVTGPFDYTKYNAILIGTPCHNRNVAEILGVTNCQSYFNPGDGMVKVVEGYGNVYLIVTGHTGSDVFKAARQFMSLAQRRQLTGTELRVTTSTVEIPLSLGEPIGGPSEAIYRGREAPRQRTYEQRTYYPREGLPLRYFRIGIS